MASEVNLIRTSNKLATYGHFFMIKISQEKNVVSFLTTQLRLGFVKVCNKSNLWYMVIMINGEKTLVIANRATSSYVALVFTTVNEILSCAY